MLLLRLLVLTADARTGALGPLPPAGEAWRLLVEAQRADPAAVETVLMHPSVGIWLALALGDLRGDPRPPGWPSAQDQDSSDTAAPAWADLGYVHALAAAAAVRAGLRFRAEVPPQADGVSLPAVGFARLPGAPAHTPAEVTHDGSGLSVRCAGRTVVVEDIDRDGPGWWAMRRLSRAAPPRTAALDDIDPWRSFLHPSAPDRLSEEALTAWQDRYAIARGLIRSVPELDPAGIAACLLSLVPLPAGTGVEPFSGTAPDAYGGLLISTTDSPARLAAALIHEAQHVKLSALADLIPLVRGGFDRRHHSPWRNDLRHVRGIFQGVYAFLGVSRFWRALAARPPTDTAEGVAEFEFALARAQTRAGLGILREEGVLTEAGARFVRRCAAAVEALYETGVSPAADRAADEAVADHEMVHRLSHWQPPPDAAERAAHALLSGGGAPGDAPAPLLRPGPLVRSPRVDMLRSRPALARDRDAPGAVRGRTDGDSSADLAWVAGDRDRALRGYLDRLAADPDDVPAWAGFGLSLPPGPAARLMRRRPDWVRAVHREAGRLADDGAAPGPDEVADRLSGPDGPGRGPGSLRPPGTTPS